MSPRFPCSFLSGILLVLIILTTRCIAQLPFLSQGEPPPPPSVNQVTIYHESTAPTGTAISTKPVVPNAPILTTPLPVAVPPEPLPEVLMNGGIVQAGPFTFFLWIYQEPSLDQNPVTTSLYSDFNGYGAYLFWVYQGPGMPGSVTEWYGIEPNLQELATYAGLKTNDHGGRSGGVFLPGGFYISGQSSPGDQLKLVIKVVIDDQTYGAALPFTLQKGPDGWQPEGIGAPAVLEKERL